MNAISLFAGVGGFDLALERAGIDIDVQCEIEPHCQELLAKRFPGTELISDVHDVGRAQGPVDIIGGGFPCQDISVAGNRAGLAGERSGLWFEYARVLDEIRPRWCIIENVAGLLSSNRGRDLGTILGTLGDLGYGFSYRVLDAQFFGVPQRRRRVFIVGCLGDERRAAEVLLESAGGCWDPESGDQARKDIAPTLAARTRGGGFPGTDEAADGYVIPAETTTVNALTRSGLGGGGPDDNLAQAGHLIASTLTARMGKRPSSDLPDEHLVPYQCHGSNVGPMGALRSGNGGVTGGVPFIAGAITGRIDRGGVNSEGWDGHLVPSPVAFHVTQDPITSETRWPTMGTGNQQGCATLRALHNLGVRKLMPIECERLQGFPDNWTEGHADTQRYRMLGNAVAVPVVQWIVDRLVAVA